MGTKSSKCKSQTSSNQIYYAVKFKNRSQVAIYDSKILKDKKGYGNNESNMYITFDADDMKDCSNDGIDKEKVTDCESSRLKDIAQFWSYNSRENLLSLKRNSSSKASLQRFNDREDQKKGIAMSPSKGKLSWNNNEDANKRNFKSTAAQVGSYVNLREGANFKNRNSKGSTCSSSSASQKDVFSESKSRCQSENFDSNGSKRKSKLSVKNSNQLDTPFDTKSKYSSDNLSDTHSTSRPRELDHRIKGGNTESYSKAKAIDQTDSRSKKGEITKLVNSSNSSKTDDDPSLLSEYIDARWQALCTSNDKDQVLVPCPTCGRRFNEEAAYRHFPICSRVKEKGSSLRGPKNIIRPNSPNSPSFINVMADTPLDKRDDGTGRKPSKPIVFTFIRGGNKSNRVLDDKSSFKSDKCNNKVSSGHSPTRNNSPAASKKGSKNSVLQKHDLIESKSRKRKNLTPRSDGVRKSASIWRKSIKEFKTIADLTTVKTTQSSTTDESSVSKIEPSVKAPMTNTPEETRNISSTCESRCLNCGKLNSGNEKVRTVPRAKSKSRKSFNGKYKSLNSKPLSRSAKDMTNLQDLDIIPQSLRVKDLNLKKSNKLENSYFESFEEKTEPCFCCEKPIRLSQMETHTFLCERIKNIEMQMSKDIQSENTNPTQPSTSKKQVSNGAASGNEFLSDNGSSKDYRLFKQGSESPSGTSLKTITSIKCPCCSQLLDLRRK